MTPGRPLEREEWPLQWVGFTEHPFVISELTVVHEVVAVFVEQDTCVMAAVCSEQLEEDEDFDSLLLGDELLGGSVGFGDGPSGVGDVGGLGGVGSFGQAKPPPKPQGG